MYELPDVIPTLPDDLGNYLGKDRPRHIVDPNPQTGSFHYHEEPRPPGKGRTPVPRAPRHIPAPGAGGSPRRSAGGSSPRSPGGRARTRHLGPLARATRRPAWVAVRARRRLDPLPVSIPTTPRKLSHDTFDAYVGLLPLQGAATSALALVEVTFTFSGSGVVAPAPPESL